MKFVNLKWINLLILLFLGITIMSCATPKKFKNQGAVPCPCEKKQHR